MEITDHLERGRRRIREKGTDYLRIIAGTFLMAFATNFFYTPANMVPGGFTGLSIILQHLTKPLMEGGVPVWIWNIILNIPLILFSVKLRGWKFMRLTFLASVLFSGWLAVLPEIDLSEQNLFLVSVIGGGLMGCGLGFVFSGKATTGGTDTLAALLQRAFPYMNTAKIMPVLDGIVILLSVWIFGITVSLYAVVTVILNGWVADRMVSGQRNACLAYIISDYQDEIARAVLEEMNRGATLLDGTGTYTNQPRKVLMCAVSRRQSAMLREIVADIDPKAFFILTEASEVRGEGFLKYSREEL